MRHRTDRSGVVLILVLVVVVLLALAAYAFTDLMLAENRAAQLHGRQIQARQLAESGIEMSRVFLMKDRDTRQEEGGLYENPDKFRGMPVMADQSETVLGRFTILAPGLDEEDNFGPLRYGLENESTRLNLGALLLADDQAEEGGRQLLMALPGMTEEIADAILDWIDEDEDQIRTYGAEAEYYSSLDPPYAPRNGLPATVEELLLVRGVTPGLLFGLDANRNGVVDLHERDGYIDAEVDNSDGTMDRGWSAYLTLHSLEHNVNSQGEPRIYLNTDDMEQLHADLSAVFPDPWVTFIIAYKQNGQYFGSKSGEMGVTGELDLSKPGRTQLAQVLDLIGKKVQVKFEGDDKPTVIESPFPDGPIAMGVYLPRLMDHVTVNAAPIIPGRINVNQAPKTILAGIPGMTEEILTEILSRRVTDPDEENANLLHETWLLTEAIVTLDEMRLLTPFVTGGGDVYRAQVVGYFDDGEASARMEVILDATAVPPTVVFWRDLSHLGRGHALETLGLGEVEE